MKKLLTVTCLAGLLSIPSVVFAEASWYGSIRVGVESTGGTEGLSSLGSRWGVQGSSEVSEGLTAVYKFEDALDATNATTQAGNRLSYVGLSGGFGTITMGRVWAATYNTVGAITDQSTAYGNSGATLRHGNAISYAVSSGNMSMQIDAILDSSKSGNTVDKLEFGVSMGIADMGKIAFAHKRVEDHTSIEMVDPGTYKSTSKVMESAVLKSTNTVTGGTVTNTLKVSDVVGTNGNLDVSPVTLTGDVALTGDVGTTGGVKLTGNVAGAGGVELKGGVTLPVSGDANPLTKFNKPKQARVQAVGCLSDQNIPLAYQPSTKTAAELETACKGGTYPAPGVTVIDPTSPKSLPPAPGVAFAKGTTSTDTKDAVISDATYTIGTGDTKKIYDVFVGKEWQKGGKKADLTIDECVGDNLDQTCKEVAFYYFNTVADDDTVTQNKIDGKTKVGGDVILVSAISVEGDLDLGGDLRVEGTFTANNGDLKVESDVAATNGDLAVTNGTLDVNGGNLSGDISVTGGVLSGTVTATPVDVDTDTTVVTDPVLETTTTKDAPVATPTTVAGSTSNYIAGEVTLGGVTGYLGYTEVKTNGSSSTASTTHTGLRGSVGESGVSYFVQLRNEETSTPWMFGLSKALGGGASVHFEYADDDIANVKSKAAAWLKVDF